MTYPLLGLIDAPWHYVLQAPLWAEELDRAAWIEELKQRWHLVTRKNGNEAMNHNHLTQMITEGCPACEANWPQYLPGTPTHPTLRVVSREPKNTPGLALLMVTSSRTLTAASTPGYRQRRLGWRWTMARAGQERAALKRRCPKCNAQPHFSCHSTVTGSLKFLKHPHKERLKEPDALPDELERWETELLGGAG